MHNVPLQGQVGGGWSPSNLEFFGPQMALAYLLNAISRSPGPNPLPIALVMDMHAFKTLQGPV
jgi:hypothetical protein